MNPQYFFKEDLGWIKEKKLFLFFDFDGTLVPIQDNPSSCMLEGKIKSYIKRIVSNSLADVAIISGRSVEDIKKRVNIKGIYYSGNHGLEIRGPGLNFIHPEIMPAIKLIKNAKKVISKYVEQIPGVFVEDKHLSFTLHFRLADKEGKRLAKSIFKQILSKEFHNMPFKVLKGKEVLELTPLIDWDKGKAVLFIIKEIGQEYIPLYIGDDLTDETAFSAIKGQGITIRIGRSKNTDARYYLRTQHEIYNFFKKICDIIEKCHKK
ncbi:MAG TPA: trehalose-phosphatase [Syntrophorhabdaceae bacterium]|nr:trehalose-phosphatase [Syntrophorhabdaceae bacterium]HPU30315.1 trehalose-phosphatase [Syntrophorhabdaceae bacterium]